MPDPSVQSQVFVASKTAKFGKISKTDETYKTALDAHALDAALKALGHEAEVKVKRTWKISPAARAKMSAAQKKRWAKLTK